MKTALITGSTRLIGAEAVRFFIENDVQCGIHYPVPIYSLDAYVSLGLTGKRFPVTEKYSKEILSLPMYPELTKVQIDEVVSAIKSFMFMKEKNHA